MKAIRIIIIIIILFVLSGCNKTNTPTLNYINNYGSKEGVDEFIDKIGVIKFGGLLNGMQLDKENVYNVTPEGFEEATGGRIFKASDSYCSLLYLDNEVYQLGEFFGGYGVICAVSCDFDEDGKNDILYSYSWGSGLHRSLISVFNTKTKENRIIYDSSRTENPSVDLIIETKGNNRYEVKSVAIKVIEDNFAYIQYEVIETIGAIESENGFPIFVE